MHALGLCSQAEPSFLQQWQMAVDYWLTPNFRILKLSESRIVSHVPAPNQL
jgi:hypothetical protein